MGRRSTPKPRGSSPVAESSHDRPQGHADRPHARAEPSHDRPQGHADRPHASAEPSHDGAEPTTLVLASGSPRRLALLRRLGIDPLVRPADIDETPRPDERVDELVVRLAREKAAAVPVTEAEVVLAADTEVALDRRPLGKPVDAADAMRMLRELSGREHQVVTGLAARCGDRWAEASVTTTVRFRHLDDREIAWYVATGEPDGKAGGYAIQDAGAVLVDRIDGSDTNVIGLPLAATVRLLRDVGLDLLR